MYRPSRSRSRSVPRLRLPVGKGQGKGRSNKNGREGKEDNRPQWDDTLQDLNKYKATPDVIARRKQQRVSKNLITLKRLSLDGSATDQYLDDPASFGAYTPDAQRSFTQNAASSSKKVVQSTNTTPGVGDGSAPSPPIDYNAVLKLLQKPPTPGNGTPPGHQLGQQDGGQASGSEDGNDVDCRHDQGTASADVMDRPSHSFFLQSAHSHSSTNHTAVPQQLCAAAEVLDATIAFRDMSGGGMAQAQPMTANAVHSSRKAASSLCGPGSRPRLLADPAGRSSKHMPTSSTAAAAVFGDTQTQQMLLGIQSKQQTLESHMTSLETLVHKLHYQNAATQDKLQQVQQDLSGHKDAQAVASQQQQELQQLQQACQQLKQEQSQLRAQFTEFSTHAGGLLTRLQAQLLQLLQSPAVTNGLNTASLGPGQAQEELSSHVMHPPGSASQHALHMQDHAHAGPAQRLVSIGQPDSQVTQHNSALTQPALYEPAQHSAASTTMQGYGGGNGEMPVANYEGNLALPSYAAMRRSAASISSTSKPGGSRQIPVAVPRGPSGPSQWADVPASPTTHHSFAALQPKAAQCTDEGQQLGAVFGRTGLSTSHDMTVDAASDGTGAGRTWPAQYQPRALGYGPALPASVAHNSSTTAAANLSHIPTAAWFSSTDAPAMPVNTSSSTFPGVATSFGVLPEPMSFNVPSDFKIVRVGGSGSAVQPHVAARGLTPSNSMSLAAHTAAALRDRQRRK